MFDGSLGTPQFVENRLVWMTPAWKAAFRHAAAEAQSARPRDVDGGERRMERDRRAVGEAGAGDEEGRVERHDARGSATVHRRAARAAVEQRTVPGDAERSLVRLPGRHDAARRAAHDRRAVRRARPDATTPTRACSRSASTRATCAWPTPIRASPPRPATSTARLLTDGDFGETVTLGIPDGANETWVQFEFPQPFRAYAFTFAGAPTTQFIGTPPIPAGRLEWSDDGQDWVTLATLPGPGHPIHQFAARTYTFEPPTARFYRLVLQRPAANPLAASLGMPPSRGIAISELELSASPRVNRWQEKAQFGIITEYGPEIATPSTGDAIAPTDIVDHHRAPAQGRHARLAGAGRPVDGAAHGLLAHRHEEPSRVARGDRLRGRQAESRARGVVLPAVHRARSAARSVPTTGRASATCCSTATKRGWRTGPTT